MPSLAPETWDAIYEQIKREFACDHPAMTLMVYLASNQIRHYRQQCSVCGDFVSAKVATLSEDERRSAPAFDVEIRRAWMVQQLDRRKVLVAEATAKVEEAFEEQRAERRDQYREYLDTPEWWKLRRLVMKRSGGTCEGCGVRPAVQVHHLTYERIYHEMLFDLVAVCRECHEALHDISHSESETA